MDKDRSQRERVNIKPVENWRSLFEDESCGTYLVIKQGGVKVVSSGIC